MIKSSGLSLNVNTMFNTNQRIEYATDFDIGTLSDVLQYENINSWVYPIP
ncbi:hypothetical protein Xentx_02887 [Xenorhabdus thuongxuanensis]|uniref:Uncharacterized protein n=1 Tax=Xenorhabdus thuongxuanensis TaxID=1873484 RepID=A0A1Q5TU63_9GAMM|nr:hypothetical protein Xentx_02887 [Xenorhabdus thuongxuanensis]